MTSAGVEESALFSESGLFLLRADRTLYFASVQTMLFARPHFRDILGALDFVIAKNYPAREPLLKAVSAASPARVGKAVVSKFIYKYSARLQFAAMISVLFLSVNELPPSGQRVGAESPDFAPSNRSSTLELELAAARYRAHAMSSIRFHLRRMLLRFVQLATQMAVRLQE